MRFTEDILRGMGAEGPASARSPLEITRGWERHENFELYEDALPVLAELRGRGLKLGLISNTNRDLAAFVRHFALDVDAWISSGSHGKVKPSPTIFRAVLELLEVEPAEAAMVGDSLSDDVEGARALGHAGVPARPRGPLLGARRRADEPRRAAGGTHRDTG